MADMPARHVLHPSYGHKVTQAWSSEHAATIPPAALVWPLFILEDVRAAAVWGIERRTRWAWRSCARDVAVWARGAVPASPG